MFQAHSGGVRDLAITPDGRRIVTAGEDDLLKRWDLRQTSHRTLGSHSGIARLALSPRGRLCACSSADWSIHVWDMQRCALLAEFTANDFITSLKVLPDERTIVAIESTGALHFLRLEGRALKPVAAKKSR
jgi:WD40 repeat protein